MTVYYDSPVKVVCIQIPSEKTFVFPISDNCEAQMKEDLSVNSYSNCLREFIDEHSKLAYGTQNYNFANGTVASSPTISGTQV